MRDLMTWLLVVGATSVFNVDSEAAQWIGERWRSDVDDLGWNEAKERLKKIMWIDALEDTMGNAAITALNATRDRYR